MNRESHRRHREKYNERNRTRYEKNKKERLLVQHQYYLNHRDKILAYARKYQHGPKREDYLTKKSATAWQRKTELKKRVFEHYSPNLVCVWCGFSDLRALSIDHINGGGIKHRKTLKRTAGCHFYKWLEDSGYPSDFQVLCMNCQFIKRTSETHRIRRPTEEIGLEASIPANKVKRVAFEA